MNYVEFQTRDMSREAEREFGTIEDAVRFADSVIEDGGSACVYTDELDEFTGLLPYRLCDVHVVEA